MKYMYIEVHLKEQAFPIVHEHAINAYTKGLLYCVYCEGGIVYKYPIQNIFRVIEGYTKK